MFDKTRTPLRTWFAAAWYLTNQKLGVSALGLQRVLGLGSYQTSWAMLHRFRRAMVRPGRARLNGKVEVVKEDASKITRVEFMVLHEGRIMFQGNASELLAAKDPYLLEYLYRTLPPW